MATIIKKEERDYQPNPNKIEGFNLFTDISREKKGINPQYLNFDLRQLNPRQYCAAYHFHRYAEEMFFILSGSATLRTQSGLDLVHEGDIIFFEAGEAGAHQLYNHTEEPCTYLDLRSYIGHDVCEYPDSEKILIVPNGETFRKSTQLPYFDGETDVDKIWDKLRKKETRTKKHGIIDTKIKSMKKDETELIMLGTGNATVTRCYNTCFILQTKNTVLLVDAGGGNGILNQLEKADAPIERIHDMFITHAHTDHILGAIWIIRIIAQQTLKEQCSNIFHVYGHDKVLLVLDQICRMTLPASVVTAINKYVQFHEVKDGDTLQVGDLSLQCFDIASTKEKQYGFRASLPDGQTLVCLGDEPYNEQNRTYAEGADWLLCEAFCLYKDHERFKPYEKHHSTALDAGRLAQQLGVKNLLLYHTEDKTLDTRKKSYTEEASQEFTGTVYVPDDLERLSLIVFKHRAYSFREAQKTYYSSNMKKSESL